MCGIAGLLDPGGGIDSPDTVVRNMTGRLVHRGPDGDGLWSDPEPGIFLGHRRLAVVDLTADGAQPMSDATGRFVIAYNGEVYNFRELRADLERLGYPFRGRSDTEVLLAAVSHWGLPNTVRKLNGMFAFALWDRLDRRLWLARDRLGKKPLYFGTVDRSFVFASELKALRCTPGFQGQIDRQSLTLFLRYNYVPAPRSIYAGVSKLSPGHYKSVEIRGERIIENESIPFWSAEQVFSEAARHPCQMSVDEAAIQLGTLLQDAVKRRMISDVPLGAFLSGGIDSSLVVALMQAQSTTPVRTFTVGFAQSDFNEAGHAKRVAKHLGTDHTEIYLSAEDALSVVPRLPEIYDEPFADSSQIPTYLICREARRFVTVALSGDGGDEGFCGYSRYLWWRKIWALVGRLPLSSRRALTSMIKGIRASTWDSVTRPVIRLLPAEFRHGAAGEKLHKLAEVLAVNSPNALYTSLISHWKNPAAIVLGGCEPGSPWDDQNASCKIDEFTNQMMLRDILTYLPDDILVKVDRASMAVSLEVRAPLLDFRVLEFAASLPLAHKLGRSSGKLVLRKVLRQFLPEQLFDRAKTGFGVPLEQWLRGPLRTWAEDLLSPASLRKDGYFAIEPVRAMWEDLTVRGKATHYYVWDILMFQTWLRHQEESPPLARSIEKVPRCGT